MIYKFLQATGLWAAMEAAKLVWCLRYNHFVSQGHTVKTNSAVHMDSMDEMYVVQHLFTG